MNQFTLSSEEYYPEPSNLPYHYFRLRKDGEQIGDIVISEVTGEVFLKIGMIWPECLYGLAEFVQSLAHKVTDASSENT